MSTATALLDAAEIAFAEHGVEDVSLRSIMRSIGANPASVHYHYGSRESLAKAVLERVLEPLQARRLELLDRLVARGSPTLEELVTALIRPDLEIVRDLQHRNPDAIRLLGTIYARPSEFVQSQIEDSFRPVAALFMPHFAAVLPDLTPGALAWRVRWFVFGPLGALLSDAGAAELVADIDREVARLVVPMCGAIRSKEVGL